MFIIFVRTRLLSFSLVLFLAFLLLVSILISAGLGIVESYADRVWGNTALLIATTSASVISFIVTACLFALIYKALPEVPLSWRDVGIGALYRRAVRAGQIRHRPLSGPQQRHLRLRRRRLARGADALVYYSAQIFFSARYSPGATPFHSAACAIPTSPRARHRRRWRNAWADMSPENTPATITLRSTGEFALFGAWTARGIDSHLLNDQSISAPGPGPMVLDAARIDALDSVGAWVLQKLLLRLNEVAPLSR